jgi:hypothetical protein
MFPQLGFGNSESNPPADRLKPIVCRELILAAWSMLPDNPVLWMIDLSRPGGSPDELPSL